MYMQHHQQNDSSSAVVASREYGAHGGDFPGQAAVCSLVLRLFLFPLSPAYNQTRLRVWRSSAPLPGHGRSHTSIAPAPIMGQFILQLNPNSLFPINIEPRFSVSGLSDIVGILLFFSSGKITTGVGASLVKFIHLI